MAKAKRPAQKPEEEKAPQTEQTPADETPETVKAPDTEEKPAAEEPTATEPEAEEPENGSSREEEAPEDLSAQIETLRAQLAEANDRLLRTLAEYDNFRKRSQREKEALYNDSKAETAARFLPVMDNFERAAAADADLETYRKGVEMTVRQFGEVLKGLGLEAFGEKGEEFDPKLHSGAMHEENEDFGENQISEVFLKGYRMGDRVIRHATVKVAN